MCLGAQRGDVMNLVLKQGLSLLLMGIGAGLVAAFALTRLMASLLFGVTATDPLTFVSVTLILAAVALGHAMCRRGARPRLIRSALCATSRSLGEQCVLVPRRCAGATR